MHIFKFFLLITSILYSQQVHLKLGQNENIVLSEDSNVEGYLDSLIKAANSIKLVFPPRLITFVFANSSISFKY